MRCPAAPGSHGLSVYRLNAAFIKCFACDEVDDNTRDFRQDGILILLEFAPPFKEPDALVELHAARLPLAFSRALSHECRVFLYRRLATLTIRLEEDLSIISVCRKHWHNIVRQLGVGETELDGALGALLLRFGIRGFRISAESVEEFVQFVIAPGCHDEGQIDILPFHNGGTEKVPAQTCPLRE
jgi:hypothetical protein